MSLSLSVIIAVYKRQDLLHELLSSLAKQSDMDFETLVIDDGSPQKLNTVVEQFSDKLRVKYFYKNNSGPGKSRNYGMERASGNYFIFLDSDVLVPSNYIANVKRNLTYDYVHAFGGPDSASKEFSDLQKAISFAMTSLLTTGGIRGKKEKLGKFQPRSFNMGISKEAYIATQGFADLRIGEDPDLSLRLWKNGYNSKLFANLAVFHKRRNTLASFARQVYQFGIARPILNQRHPTYTKPVFWLPSMFFFGTFIALISSLFSAKNLLFLLPLSAIFIYTAALFLLSFYQNKSLKVALLSIVTSFIQLLGYGYGFMQAQIELNLLKRKAEEAFPSHFYKEIPEID